MRSKEPDDFDGSEDQELDDEVLEDEATENVPTAQVWVEVTSPMNGALDRIHSCIMQGEWETNAIVNFAEAVSNAISRDVTEHPEWLRLDRKYGPVNPEFGAEMEYQEFIDRFHAIRQLARAYNLMGRKAQQGEPAKFLSFASLVPKVRP